MTAASSSGAWDLQALAGAAEPGAGNATEVLNDETVFRVAFYTVGIHQSALDTRKNIGTETLPKLRP